MAPPHGETTPKHYQRQTNLSNENLKRTISDTSTFFLSNDMIIEEIASNDPKSLIPPISEPPQEAKCECCGMNEEYTLEYINQVRNKYSGKWICGLCSEAVKGEMEKNGATTNLEALEVHMGQCVRFNKLGRAYPVLCQAQAMKEMLKKSPNKVRAKSISPRDLKAHKGGGGLARSSSCMPAIIRDIDALKIGN